MAEATQESALADTTIIDSDIHLRVQKDVADYASTPYDKMLDSNPFVSSGWDRYLGGKIEPKTVHGPDDIQQTLCEEFHVDYPVVNTFARLGRCNQTDLAVNLAPAFNDLLIDQYLDAYDHFRGLMTVAPHEPDKAAEEIDRVADNDQIVGVYIDSTGSYPPLGDSTYDVMYQACEDNDLPICYHGNGGGFVSDFNVQNKGVETFLEVHVLSHLWSQTLTLTSLIVNGTPVKFPDLDFVILEAGVAWIPYFMYRLNKEYSIRRSEAPLLEKSPEEYIRERFYFSTQPIGEPNDPSELAQIIDIVGTDRLMFSTDYPHWDFDHPEGLDKYIRTTFSKEERDQVLHGTASNVFGIDV